MACASAPQIANALQPEVTFWVFPQYPVTQLLLA